MAKLELPARKLTYEEFLTWCDEDTWAEWVDGEVVVLSPASVRHQQLVDFLVQTLGVYVQAKGLGLLLSAPFQMKTGPDLPGREPDLLFVARENLGRLKDRYLEGPADLVVEVVSPESRLRDRGGEVRGVRGGRGPRVLAGRPGSTAGRLLRPGARQPVRPTTGGRGGHIPVAGGGGLVGTARMVVAGPASPGAGRAPGAGTARVTRAERCYFKDLAVFTHQPRGMTSSAESYTHLRA
jgi:hypothetical protein